MPVRIILIAAACVSLARLAVAEPSPIYSTYVTEGAGSCGVCFIEHRDGGIVCGVKGWYRKSDDGGRTWTQLYPFTEQAGTKILRLKDGRLMSVWHRDVQNVLGNKLGAKNFYASFSSDEGRTWEGEVPISTDNRCLYLMNDRVVRLSNGRILVPFALHPNELLDKKMESVGWAGAFYSDDEGQTWQEGQWLKPTVADQLCEPCVFERRDGSLKMLVRTGMGWLYESISHDGGETWETERATTLRSPLAPFFVKRDPYTGLVWIVWCNSFPGLHMQTPRCPLSLAVSRDDGETWRFVCDLEGNPMNSYGYPSIHFTEEGLVMAYYEQKGHRGWKPEQQSCKLTIFPRRTRKGASGK